MTVALNDIVLAMKAGENDPTATPGYYLENLGDWDAVPDAKSDVRERAQADGAHAIAFDFHKSLPFSVRGNFLGVSRADVQAAKAKLKGSLARGVMVPVVVNDVDGPKSRLASVRHLSFDNDRYGAKEIGFTIDLLATDPRMYGPTMVLPTSLPTSGGGLLWPLGTTPTKYFDFGPDGSTGSVTFTNLGNAPTYPDLIAYGGMDGGFIATDVTLGQTVKLSRLIPPGSAATVRQRTERAYIDTPTNDVSGQITSLSFFAIGPGETHTIAFAPLGTLSGTPSFAVSVASAYI